MWRQFPGLGYRVLDSQVFSMSARQHQYAAEFGPQALVAPAVDAAGTGRRGRPLRRCRCNADDQPLIALGDPRLQVLGIKHLAGGSSMAKRQQHERVCGTGTRVNLPAIGGANATRLRTFLTFDRWRVVVSHKRGLPAGVGKASQLAPRLDGRQMITISRRKKKGPPFHSSAGLWPEQAKLLHPAARNQVC